MVLKQPDAPAYFTYAAVLNSRERPTLDTALARELKPLTLDRVLALQKEGAEILDTRDPADFGAAHLAGSLNIGLVGQYANVASERLATHAPLAVDVRSPQERDQKRVRGSLSLPLNDLADRLAELPRTRPLIVYCAGGYRSSIAASLLQRQGFGNVAEMAGGITAWDAAGLPLESSSDDRRS